MNEPNSKHAAMYMHWTTEYGHVYQDCLTILYNIDVIFPQYDSVLVQMTKRMQTVINFFGLTLSSKLKFIYGENNLNPIPEFAEFGRPINRPNEQLLLKPRRTNISKQKALLTLKKEFQRLKPIVNTPKNYLIFCSRNGNTISVKNNRRMKQQNEDDIVAYLKEYANEHNLEFYLLTGQEPDGTPTSISKQYELFTNAKIAIGPHGAAFANIIHLDPAKKAKVIEFCSNKNPEGNFMGLYGKTPAMFCEYHKIMYDGSGRDVPNNICKYALADIGRIEDLPDIDIMQIKSLLE